VFGRGTWELLIILVIVVMVFGVGKLPQVAKELGSGVRGFKKALNDDLEDDDPKQLDAEEPAGKADSKTKSKAEAEA
jgi:sec-independent protein translocase protein TatA